MLIRLENKISPAIYCIQTAASKNLIKAWTFIRFPTGIRRSQQAPNAENPGASPVAS